MDSTIQMTKLWPQWKATDSVLFEWERMFKGFADDVCRDCLTQIWRDGNFTTQPSPKHFLDCARVMQAKRYPQRDFLNFPVLAYSDVYVACLGDSHTVQPGYVHRVKFIGVVPDDNTVMSRALSWARIATECWGGNWTIWEGMTEAAVKAKSFSMMPASAKSGFKQQKQAERLSDIVGRTMAGKE